MKTLDEAFAIIEGLNEEAHGMAWDTWIEADDLEDSEEIDAKIKAYIEDHGTLIEFEGGIIVSSF